MPTEPDPHALAPDEQHLLQRLAAAAPAPPTARAVRARLAARRRRRRLRVTGLVAVASAAAVALVVGLGLLSPGDGLPDRPPTIADDNAPAPRSAPDDDPPAHVSNTPDAPDAPPDAPPTATAVPIAHDASLTTMQDTMTGWLQTVGAHRAEISKFPGRGVSISVSGSNVPPEQLTADLSVLLANFDLVNVHLDARGVRCSMSQLN